MKMKNPSNPPEFVFGIFYFYLRNHELTLKVPQRAYRHAILRGQLHICSGAVNIGLNELFSTDNIYIYIFIHFIYS